MRFLTLAVVSAVVGGISAGDEATNHGVVAAADVHAAASACDISTLFGKCFDYTMADELLSLVKDSGLKKGVAFSAKINDGSTVTMTTDINGAVTAALPYEIKDGKMSFKDPHNVMAKSPIKAKQFTVSFDNECAATVDLAGGVIVIPDIKPTDCKSRS